MMSGDTHTDTNSDVAGVSVLPVGGMMAVEDEMDEGDPAAARQQKLIKAGPLAVLVAIVIYVVLDYTISGLGFVSEILEWVEDNPALGAVAFAAAYVFTTIFFIPDFLLTIVSGLVFGRALGTGLGVLVGSVAVVAGATTGAILAFLLGRFVLREQARGLFSTFNILKAVGRAIETGGWKLGLLLRLSPVVPFSVLNYAMGVTAVQFRDYAIGCVGIIPGTVAYVFIGTAVSRLLRNGSEDESEDDDDSGSSVQNIVFIVGGIATRIAVVLISRRSKREINKVLKEDMEAEERMANNNGAEIEGGTMGAEEEMEGREMGATAAVGDVQEQGTPRPSALAYPVRSQA